MALVHVVASLASAQPAIQWQKCLGGPNTEEAHSVQRTIDGGCVMAGTTTSNGGDVSGYHGGSSDAWVVKLDAAGTLQWQKCLGGSSDDEASSIQQTADGGYVVAGSTRSNDGDVSGYHAGGFTDAWVVKLDAAGALQWQKCLGGSFGEGARSIQRTADSGYVIAGYTNSLDDGDVSGFHHNELGDIIGDVWVVKLDATGTLQWQKCLGGTGDDQAYSIQQTADGGYVVAGDTNSDDDDVSGYHGGGYFDTWVVKLDAVGTLQWQKCLGGSDYEEGYAIQQTTDNGYVVAGYTSSTDGDVSGFHGGYDAWVVKLNAAGTLQWQKCLGGSDYEGAFSIQRTADGGYVVAGYAGSTDGDVGGNHGSYDAWVVKLDDAGTLQWQKSLGGSSDDRAASVQQTADGGYVVAGYATSTDGDVAGNHGDEEDAWVMRLGATTGITEADASHFTLAPNPARTSVTIGLAPGARPLYAALRDASGRTVSVHPTSSAAGPITLDLSGCQRGSYVVEVRFADGTRAMERVVKQ